MTFEYILITVALIVVSALIIFVVTFLKRTPSVSSDDNTVYVSKLALIKSTVAYKVAAQKLRSKTMVAVIAGALIVLISSVGASRAVTVEVKYPEKYNRDIVLCLDASGSMFDVNAAILEQFKNMSKSFQGERIALTVFNATSVNIFPLTDDYEYIATQLSQVQEYFVNNYNDPDAAAFLAKTLGREEGASMIGDGLYSCSLNFDNTETSKDRSRSIIFATDNMLNGAPIVSLEEAIALDVEKNIRVYGINPGSRGEGVGYVSDAAIQEMSKLTQTTGGATYMMKHPTSAVNIIASIQESEAKKMRGAGMIMKQDAAELVIYTLLVLLTGLISYAAWRRV